MKCERDDSVTSEAALTRDLRDTSVYRVGSGQCAAARESADDAVAADTQNSRPSAAAPKNFLADM